MRRCNLSHLAAIVLALVSSSPASSQPAKAGQSDQARRAEMLERFRALTPQARWALLEKHGVKPAWHTVAKGEVVAEVLERGTVEAVQTTDITCRIKSGDMVIKWVVEDGTPVKRGDKILELDDSSLRDQAKTQRVQVELALAQREQATREAALVQREGKLAIREAAADVAAAERDAKAYTGGDPAKKEALALKVERARVTMERAAVVLQGRLLQSETELRTKTSVVEQEQARLQALQEEIQQCVTTAPHDGYAVHHASNRAIVAVGEPVRHGQKLLRVDDARRLAVRMQVAEAYIAGLRGGMPAAVRLDAFPNEAPAAKVATIAAIAAQDPWLARNIKVYPVLIHLEGEHPRYKPGMTAEVRVLLHRRDDVLAVPASAVIRSGKELFCYVRDGKDKIEARAVVSGLWGNRMVEVREGLNAGDQVLPDPGALVRSLENIPPPRSDNP